MITLKRLFTICLFSILYLSPTFGCIYNVRDLGFSDILCSPYYLYFFVQKDTPAELVSSFEQISHSTFIDGNIKVEIINVDQEKENDALEYLNFWDIHSLPASILVSPTGRSKIIPVSEYNNYSKEEMWSSLETVISSPIRDEIRENIIRAYCVILIVEGKSETVNSKVSRIVTDVGIKIARTMTQLPKRIENPPHKIVLSRELVSKENILLWSLDMNDKVGKDPMVVIIYGRGRKFGPVLKGREIESGRLMNILSIIGFSCECGLEIKTMMGPLIPLRWGEKERTNVVNYLGFDVENPIVKMEMGSILSINSSTSLNNNDGSFEIMVDGYREEVVKNNNRSINSRVTPSQLRNLSVSDSDDFKSALNLKFLIYVMTCFFVLIIAGSGFVLLRTRWRKL